MIRKQELISEYKLLLELCKEYNLEEYIEKLDLKMKSLEEPLRFMIVGEGKSGKSTLLNALVGEDVAEVDDMPKTWCINAYYNTQEKPFAELIYPESVQMVSIEEAKEISGRMSSCKRRGHKEKAILESDYQLQEIRWHLNLKWPGENVVLIDTPGLGQDRADTYCETISIDGAEGIQYEAEDGFESFQYKADLLLWCFNAENTGDEIVERKLKKIPIDAGKIYGIVTRLDEHDIEDRETLFLNCEKHYKKYVKQCLRSSLPNVDDADTPEEAEEMLRMRKETIESIRWCIEFLLKDNATLEVIKLESSAKYLEGIKQQIAASLKSYLVFYFENYQLYNKILQNYLKDQEAEEERAIREIAVVLERAWQKFVSDSYLSGLWFSAGENAEIYAEILTQQMNDIGLLQQLDRISERYQNVAQELFVYAINNIKWTDILIRSGTEEKFHMSERKVVYEGEIKPPVIDKVSVHLEDMGLVYKLSQWAESAGFGTLIKALAGNYLRSKAIELGRDAIGRKLGVYDEQYKGFVRELSDLSRKSFSEIIEESFLKQTGKKPEQIEETMIDIEQKMTLWKWYDKEVLYYPFVEGEKVSFIQAVYFPKLTIYQKQSRETVLLWLEENILNPVFEEQRDKIEKIYLKALSGYNGSKMMKKPYCDEKVVLIEKNVGIQKRIPYIRWIAWDDMREKVDEKYELFRSDYEQYCLQQWSLKCADVTKKLIKEKGDELQRFLQKEYFGFSKVWFPQLRNLINGCVARKEFFRLPLETEYIYFFQYYYYPTHAAEKTMLFLKEYEQTGQVPKLLMEKVTYVSAEGHSMEELFNQILKDILERILKQLYDYKKQIMKCWDKEVDLILKQITDHYEQGFGQIDVIMETMVMPAWKEYQEKAANYGVHRIKNPSEYMRKSGKIPKQYLQLLDANVTVSEIGMMGYFVFSDGKTVYDAFIEWLQERNQRFMDKWS